MRRRARLGGGLALLLALAGARPALADKPELQTIKHAKSGLQLDAPTRWRVNPSGPDKLELGNDDNELVFYAWATAAPDLAEAMDGLDKQLGKVLDDPTYDGQFEKTKLHGAPAYLFHGKGTAENAEVVFHGAMILLDAPVVVVAYGPAETFKAAKDELDAMIRSVRKL